MRFKDIESKDLYGEQRELAEMVGMDIYLELVEKFGGSALYIAKPDKLLTIQRDKEIRKKFDGKNYRDLAKSYGLSEVRVRSIIENRERKR